MKIFNWIAGMLLPLVALAVEYTWEPCRGLSLDPIPTVGHVALVLVIPVTHVAWARGSRGRLTRLGMGVSLSICSAYCLLFLTIIPMLFAASLFFTRLLQCGEVALYKGFLAIEFCPVVPGLGHVWQVWRPRVSL